MKMFSSQFIHKKAIFVLFTNKSVL